MKKFAFLFILSIVGFSAASIAQTGGVKPAKSPKATAEVKAKAGEAVATVAQPAPKKGAKVAAIQFPEIKHEFGTVKEGDLATYEFAFKNTGKAPLILTSVSASCGCTTPEWPREPIAPGKSGKIKAIYNSKGRPGAFTKQITVVSNAGAEPTILTIGGNVEKVESGVPEAAPAPASPVKQ